MPNAIVFLAFVYFRHHKSDRAHFGHNLNSIDYFAFVFFRHADRYRMFLGHMPNAIVFLAFVFFDNPIAFVPSGTTCRRHGAQVGDHHTALGALAGDMLGEEMAGRHLQARRVPSNSVKSGVMIVLGRLKLLGRGCVLRRLIGEGVFRGCLLNRLILLLCTLVLVSVISVWRSLLTVQ